MTGGTMNQSIEIGRLKNDWCNTNHIAQVAFACQTCRRVVTVKWDSVKNEIVFYATVPVPRKVAIMIETDGSRLVLKARR
jgi:hypothetical protein